MEQKMSKTQPIRVVIVDDHMMVRDGIRVFLANLDDILVAGEAASGQELLQQCQEIQPDVILMDMVMPEMSGPETTREVKRICPDAQIIALTSFHESDLVQHAIEAGAIGYLYKDVYADQLAQAIRDAHHGHSTIDAGAARALIEMVRQPKPLGHDLTPRELEVLALLVSGKTNNEIADVLFISAATVRLHVSNILAKLGAANRTEAASLAIQHDLVER
jgi:NarL family two-component system response regulator LiaR